MTHTVCLPESRPIRPPLPSEPLPFHELLGLEIVSTTSGNTELRLTVDERHLRDNAIVHGGVFGTLLDAGIGLAARSLSPAANRLVTAQLNLNFVRPAVGGDVLTVRGEVLHVGKSSVVARADVHRCPTASSSRPAPGRC